MSEITLEQTHALLERLAEYVMTQVPTRREMNERFEQVDKRFEQVDKRFEQVDKRFEQIDKRFEQIDNDFDQIHKQLNLIWTEQRVFSKTFELHHKRLELLEEESPTWQLREKKVGRSKIET